MTALSVMDPSHGGRAPARGNTIMQLNYPFFRVDTDESWVDLSVPTLAPNLGPHDDPGAIANETRPRFETLLPTLRLRGLP